MKKILLAVLFQSILLLSFAFSTVADPAPTPKPTNKPCCKKVIDKVVASKESCEGQFALVFLVDKSGSVNGKKLDLFKSFVKHFIDVVPEGNDLSIIGFDSNPFIVRKMGILMNADKDSARRRTDMLMAHGSTDLSTSVNQARLELLKSNAKCKSIIVLTDGVLKGSGDFELTLTKQLKSSHGINVSAALLQAGDEDDSDSYERLVMAGGGFFLRTAKEEFFSKNVLSEISKLIKTKL